jgi:hypothetical protein
LLVPDLFWEKSTAGWWRISQANGLQVGRAIGYVGYRLTCLKTG